MKYVIRSVKYFFWFAAIFTLIVSALVLTGMAEGDIDSLFRGGRDALWKIAMFFAIVSAVSPKLGFMTREVPVQQTWSEIGQDIKEFMKDRRYDLESEGRNESGNEVVTFRFRGMSGRLSKMYEDRITMTFEDGRILMEGLRKDVLRLATGLEHRFSNDKL